MRASGPVVALAALVAGLAGCKEKTDLYCCSTDASCQRSGGGDGPVRCTDPERPFCDDEGAFPDSEGIRNTCIADPGEPPECEQASECTDPARPLCEDGRCVACAGPTDCDAAAPVCDQELGECVGCSQADDCAGHADATVCAADGACVGCDGMADCEATAPVCDDETRTCRACAQDADCGSGACDRIEGTCADDSAVLFVTPDGRGAQCTRNLPCGSLADAAAAATADRTLVRIAAGTYTGTTTLSAVRLRVFADPGTILRPTPGGSVTVDVTGASDVLFHSIEITGATGDLGARAIRCIDLDGSPTLRLVEAAVKDAPGLGIEASSCALTVERSVVSGNSGGGISATGSGSALTINSSTIGGNAGGGISATGSRFTLVNNFIVQNGGAGALVGGASLSGAADSRLEHNTIAGNVRSAGAVAGLLCVGSLVGTNNLIFGNSNGAAEVSSECSHRFSLIGPEPEDGEGNRADPPTFADASSGDFHLAPRSVGIDQAEASSVSEDIDGDPRPQGDGADIGADEVPAR
jgi:hypothetical protein